MTRFTIEIRESDDPRVVHLILRDQNGRRAERVCQNGQELADLLDGWTGSYRCDARELLLQALNRASPAVVQLLQAWNRSMTASSPQFMSRKGVERLMRLAKDPYRPREITDLRNSIDGETRATVLAAGITGTVDYGRIEGIVRKRLQFDRLCGRWGEGELD